MATKQLKIGSKIINVEQVYPFRYDYGKGKEVLRIDVLDTIHSFEDLLILKDCTTDIGYIEDDVLKITYYNYSMDFNCLYNNGKFNIEITRKSDETIRIELLEKAFNESVMG